MRNNDNLSIPMPCDGHVAVGEPVFSTVPGTMLDTHDGHEWQACVVMRACRRCGWFFRTGESVRIRDGRAELSPG
jgi:hypothetical protein